MAGTTDFVPFATSSTANVESQADYIAAQSTQTGFQSGVASSADCNKVWRQSTFIAAGIATFTANQLSINVPDDGNLTNFVTNFADALTSNATAAANSVVNSALSTFTLPFTKITGEIANDQVPESAVTQYQANLSIAWSQITGTKNADELQGYTVAIDGTASTIVLRDGAANLFAGYLNQASANNENPSVSQVMVNNGSDGFLRKAGIAYLLEQMMLSGAVTLEADPGTTPSTGTPGSIIAYY